MLYIKGGKTCLLWETETWFPERRTRSALTDSKTRLCVKIFIHKINQKIQILYSITATVVSQFSSAQLCLIGLTSVF